MTSKHSAYFKREIIANGVTNAVINCLIAWFLMKGKGTLVWWGPHSFGIDVPTTAFLLPFLMALIVIPLHRNRARKGSIAALAPDTSNWLGKLVEIWPRSVFLAALLFGLICMIIFASITLLGFYLLSIDEIRLDHYLIFKTTWTGLMAAIVARPMIGVALRP